MLKITKNTVVFYHEHCADGFASAYTAWKKFKGNAEYIALSHTSTGKDILKGKKIKINDLKNKTVFFIDFCVKEEELKSIQKVAKNLTVIDHHAGNKKLVESLDGSVFKDGVSAAYLAHQYFFPKMRVPKLIRYISIGDTYTWGKEKFEREILSYIYTLDFNFKIFAKAEKDLENKKRFFEIKKIGMLLGRNYKNMITSQIDNAVKINFEGYDIYTVNASSIFKNELGHELAKKSKAKFSLVYSFRKGELKVSLRGDNKINLIKMAEKFGGGGHFNASSFILKGEKDINEFMKKIIS